jgi:hypothetical protein
MFHGIRAAERNDRTPERQVPRLGAITIAKNEACNIGARLDQLAFCNERIVVDGDSDDGTPEIARPRDCTESH